MFQQTKRMRVLAGAIALALALPIHGAVAQTIPDNSGLSSTSNTNAAAQAAIAAAQAAQSQRIAQIASFVMAGVLASQCKPMNQMPCVLAGMAALQGMSLGQTSMGAGMSAIDNSSIPKTVDIPKIGSPGSTVQTVDGIKQTLADNGATISSDGKTMSVGGKTVPLDNPAMSTAEGAAAAGFSSDEFAAGQSALMAAQAAVENSKMKVGGPEIAASGGGGARNGASDGGGGGGGGTMRIVIPPRGGADLSGMSKNLGNDKIGVAADDIFKMITRRIKTYEDSKSLWNNASGKQ